MDLPFIIFSYIFLQLYFHRSLRITPSLCLSLESSYSLAHLRSCVAVWVTQVIMVNNCAISMETSPWSGMSSFSACLHAAVLNRWRDHFVCMTESQWDVSEQFPICVYEHVLYVSVHARVALLIPTL